MPTCFCTSFGCATKGGLDPTTNSPRGVPVDHRTFKSHQLQDRATIARDATRRVLDARDADIAQYMASMALADRVSGAFTQPGGRLWSKPNPASQGSATMPQNLSLGSSEPSIAAVHSHVRPHAPKAPSPSSPQPSQRSRVDSHIRRLVGIEASVVDLAGKVSLELMELRRRPGELPSPPPLTQWSSACTELRNQLDTVKGRQAAVVETKRSIGERLDEVQRQLDQGKREWNKKLAQHSTEVVHEMKTDHHFTPFLQHVDPVLQVSLFLVVACQVVLNVGRRGCHFMLAMLQYIVQLTMMRTVPHLSPREQKLMSDFPVDPRSAVDHFNLDGKSVIYAVCPNPKCHRTYKPTIEGDSPIAQYPKYCTHREFRGGPRCKERLTKPQVVMGEEIQVPIKTFVSFDFKDWVAGLTSRPGLEDCMDSAWKKAAAGGMDEMHDIFDGAFLREFQGPDKQHFSVGGDEGRYVFSLCVDFFNPYTNKQAGKKASIGLISLVCLNLPPELRYKPENMFLAGIIPGPQEPPLTAINHYLTPLIDDFLDFWQTGVRFSRTHRHPGGRLVRCALVAVICDLPAARKVGGFAAFSHDHFCSVCQCTRTTHGYGNTDCDSWIRRSNADCRACAERYHSAGDEKARQALFDKSGVRWSELLRLPYFDIARCVVVDGMHNLFLGLIKEHFEGILGIRLKKTEELPVVPIEFSSTWREFSLNEQKSVKKLQKYLQGPMAAELAANRPKIANKFMRCHARALEFACAELKCPAVHLDPQRKASKIDWVDAILAWRQAQSEKRETGANTSTAHGHVLTTEEMEEIWSDIRNMVTPSWATSVPKDLGSSTHGKVKADQWRVLGTTYLPVSLIRLWTKVHSGNERSERCSKILSATISLLSAIVIVSSRVTSHRHAGLYLQHLQSYLRGIRELFPEYQFHPNHHMALHLHEYLLLYGPLHAWWTFPFERIIGTLQRIPTSSKMGELEETMSRSYTRSANLRSILCKSQCPQALRHCQAMFEKLLNPQVRDSLITDMLAASAGWDTTHEEEVATWNENTARSMPASLRHALAAFLGSDPPQKGQLLSHLTIHGITYTVSSKHDGNSCILVQTEVESNPVPARIEYVVQLHTPEGIATHVAVRRLRPVPAVDDPFEAFPVLRARMWGVQLADLEIISVDHIHAHFAYLLSNWEGQDVTVVISMSRVY